MLNCEKVVLDENTSLACWLLYWLEMYIRPVAKASTYESYRGHCEKHIIPALGETELKNLTSKQIQLFFNKESKTGNGKTGGALSPKTIRNMRGVLDVALKQALAEELILSIGKAQGSPADYHSFFDLISLADKALYVVKKRTHSAEFGGHDRRTDWQ